MNVFYKRIVVFSTIFSILFFFDIQAQVKIGNNPELINPSAILELESSNSALVLTNVSNISHITNPINGMMVYDKSVNIIRLYQNNSWSSSLASKFNRADFTEIYEKGVKDLYFGDGVHDLIYIPIVAEDGRIWLNNNLGANYANLNSAAFNPLQQAKSQDDFNAYGFNYQWGRLGTGHHLINWTSSSSGIPVNTYSTSKTDNINEVKFISPDLDVTDVNGADWKQTPFTSSEITSMVNGSYSNCPVGYRLPTRTEFQNLINAIANSSTNVVSGGFKMAKAFNSKLKLSAAGIRRIKYNYNDTGGFAHNVLIRVGERGVYHTLDHKDGYETFRISLNPDNYNTDPGPRAVGYSIRCIKKQ